ncbi:alpha/beta fold hydrolase [Clostridium sp. AL.422]|uniref:alpha/beta fold hydrolase n=1 Tax=Clostridium TaxID=1485 RepID=UPI00293DD7FD|nr:MULTISPECIES: alpha/beta fold hydrolase [unclassified Clostridium]MDV4152320.1 alpha/beta fold hydrolase [Clostridium sp. AL.422]
MDKYIFTNSEGSNISYLKWGSNKKPKGIIQLVHGMSEYIQRYDYFAQKLVADGYLVYGHNHCGHGDSSESIDKLGDIEGENKFYTMLEDIKVLNSIIKKENEGMPIILFGHSMGSFLSQRYIQEYGETIDGLILSGSNGKPKLFTKAGVLVCKFEMMLKGKGNRSKLMDKLSFGGFNSSVKSPNTDFDWLCSDDKEVNKYIEDDFCGFIYTTEFYLDLINGLWDIYKQENLDKIKKFNIPIFIFSGDRDPVGYMGKGIIDLYNTYNRIGVKEVNYKLYKGYRHEMLNEFNKDEVISDIISWVNKCDF